MQSSSTVLPLIKALAGKSQMKHLILIDTVNSLTMMLVWRMRCSSSTNAFKKVRAFFGFPYPLKIPTTISFICGSSYMLYSGK